jgi:hypothetical protein
VFTRLILFFEEKSMTIFSEQSSIVENSAYQSLLLLLSFVLCVLLPFVPVERIWFIYPGSFQIVLILINFFVLLYVLIRGYNFEIGLHAKAVAQIDILACFSQSKEKAVEDMLALEHRGVDIFPVLLKLRDQYDVKELFHAYEKCLLKRYGKLDEEIEKEIEGKGLYGDNQLPALREERSFIEALPSWRYFENERRVKVGEKSILDTVVLYTSEA